MRISQLAERSGVPATTLRFYESAGLLPAARNPSGYRIYDEDAVRRLAFIGTAKHLGLPLEEIGALLTVWESGACADVKADARPRIAARLAEAERRAAELRAFAASLRAALAHFDALPDRAGPCGPSCGLPSPTAPPDTEPWRRPRPSPAPSRRTACATAPPGGAPPSPAPPAPRSPTASASPSPPPAPRPSPPSPPPNNTAAPSSTSPSTSPAPPSTWKSAPPQGAWQCWRSCSGRGEHGAGSAADVTAGPIACGGAPENVRLPS